MWRFYKAGNSLLVVFHLASTSISACCVLLALTVTGSQLTLLLLWPIRPLAPITSRMARAPLQLPALGCVLLLCRCLAEAERTMPIQSNGGNGCCPSWGYVEVRNNAHMFWTYLKSPQRVSSTAKPWPILLYAVPASSKPVKFEGLNMEPRYESTWLKNGDILFVDSPVGTGLSYYGKDASPDVKNASLSQGSADVVELLKQLTKQIPNLQSNPLILLGRSYAGEYAAQISASVVVAIQDGELNLKVAGVVFWIAGEATVMPLIFEFPKDNSSDNSEQAM